MPNTNAPFGLDPLGSIGVAPNFELVEMRVAYNDTTKIYTGDPVKRINTGYVAQWTATTAVSQLAGIFMGCRYLSTAQGKMVRSAYWPGADLAVGNDCYALVLPINPGSFQKFAIQTNATGAAFADIGLNYDITVGTGSTVTGRSGAVLDISTGATTATLPFRLVGLVGAGGNGSVGPGTEAGAYNWAIVVANVNGATGL